MIIFQYIFRCKKFLEKNSQLAKVTNRKRKKGKWRNRKKLASDRSNQLGCVDYWENNLDALRRWWTKDYRLPKNHFLRQNIFFLQKQEKVYETKISKSYQYRIKCQYCPHIETSQLICTANQLTGFYMRATLAMNAILIAFTNFGLINLFMHSCSIIFEPVISSITLKTYEKCHGQYISLCFCVIQPKVISAYTCASSPPSLKDLEDFDGNITARNHLMRNALRENCPNTELFLVHIFLYSDRIQRFMYPYSVRMQENTDQK